MMSSLQLSNWFTRRLGLALVLPATLVGAIAISVAPRHVQAQTGDGRALTLRSDIQEANSRTGVITARGNVQINYPARQIQATAAQAQYFSRERRIILSGNVYVLQQGNSLRGETITYLIDEGRFVALPQQSRQVESVYIIPDAEAPTQQSSSSTAAPRSTATSATPFDPQPLLK